MIHQVAKRHHHAAESEETRAQQRERSRRAPANAQHIGAGGTDEIMSYKKEPDRAKERKQRKNNIGRIENSGLRTGQKGKTHTKLLAPERDFAGLETPRQHELRGIKVGTEITIERNFTASQKIGRKPCYHDRQNQ